MEKDSSVTEAFFNSLRATQIHRLVITAVAILPIVLSIWFYKPANSSDDL